MRPEAQNLPASAHPDPRATPASALSPLSPESSALSTSQLHTLETYLFTHNRDLRTAAAALDCRAIDLHLFLHQPDIAPIVEDVEAAENRRACLPIIRGLEAGFAASEDLPERRRTGTIIINYYTKGTRPKSPRRATGSGGSATEPVATPSTSSTSPPRNDPDPDKPTPPRRRRPQTQAAPADASRAITVGPKDQEQPQAPAADPAASHTGASAASHIAPANSTDGAATVRERFAAPHQSAPVNDPSHAPTNTAPTASPSQPAAATNAAGLNTREATDSHTRDDDPSPATAIAASSTVDSAAPESDSAEAATNTAAAETIDAPPAAPAYDANFNPAPYHEPIAPPRPNPEIDRPYRNPARRAAALNAPRPPPRPRRDLW